MGNSALEPAMNRLSVEIDWGDCFNRVICDRVIG
jgi:hypothetical protein